MRRRPRSSSAPPAPPAVRALVVDGGNVIASGRARALERLALALDWCAAFCSDLPVEMFVDHAALRYCTADAEQWLRRHAAPGAGPRLLLCAPGEPADAPLLRRAAELQALVLSNDRFFDHAALRTGLLTLQFVLARGAFAPADHATWFRARGPAVRVPLAALQGFAPPSG